jgi:hypothetical protein
VLVQNLTAMGMQPYGMTVPTGYSMTADTWQNEGALLARINFCTGLTQGKFPNVQFDPANLIALGILTSSGEPKAAGDAAQKQTGVDFSITLLENTILGSELSPSDEAIVRKQMQEPDVERKMKASPLDGMRLVAGFILASPEFQRR